MNIQDWKILKAILNLKYHQYDKLFQFGFSVEAIHTNCLYGSVHRSSVFLRQKLSFQSQNSSQNLTIKILILLFNQIELAICFICVLMNISTRAPGHREIRFPQKLIEILPIRKRQMENHKILQCFCFCVCELFSVCLQNASNTMSYIELKRGIYVQK